MTHVGEEAIVYAHAVKIEALAQPGLILKSSEKIKGAKGSVVTGSKREPLKDPTPTYKDYGLSPKTAVVAQQLP